MNFLFKRKINNAQLSTIFINKMSNFNQDFALHIQQQEVKCLTF